MKSNRMVAMVGIAVMFLALLACDAGNLIALVNPTATPTRTVFRPTFTPRPSDTPTPLNTDTPTPSPTPGKTATSTRAPVVAVVRTATKAPVVPPTPSFLYKVKNGDGTHGSCPQAGVYQVKGRVFGTSDYVADVLAVIQGANGTIIDKKLSWGRQSMNLEFNVSCFEEKNLFNYQLDATVGRGNEPMQLFLARSLTDLTPISPPQSITFGSGARWYVDFYQ